jgi:DMSO reductase anchor subunit
MHPAFSVIFLTTLIGVGQGLFLALYMAQIYSMMNMLPAQNSQTFYAVGSLLVLIFLALGLFASFFHLGHPLRAWRSAAGWRTSWLAREVLVLPTTMFLIALYGAVHYFGWTEPLFTLAQTQPIDLSLIIGALAMLSTFILFICTSMIYAGIKFLPEWHNPLTIVNYILLGTASGYALAAAFGAIWGNGVVEFYALWAIVLTVGVFVTRVITLLHNRNIKPQSNLQTAIGVRHTIIAQKAQGSMGGSFNTREFFHNQSLDTLKTVKITFLILVFPIPIILLLGAISGFSPFNLAIGAFVIQYLGLIAERWHFFIEGKHPQNLYYQTVA